MPFPIGGPLERSLSF